MYQTQENTVTVTVEEYDLEKSASDICPCDVPDVPGEGCTPGYWKIKSNDMDHCWCSEYYANPLLTQVYDPAALALYGETRKNSEGFADETLDDALDFKGGGDLEGAARKLLRHGTAALLNACTLNGGGNYPEDADMIIADINAALASEKPETINDLKNRYGCWNEGLPCTIDANCRDKEPPLDPPVLTCEDEDGVTNNNDGDGVTNENDECEDTPADEIVDPSNGCSIEQLVPCDGDWKNHGKYVKASSKVLKKFKKAGLITKFEKRALMKEKKRSDCGR
jgi:hypothetical protein